MSPARQRVEDGAARIDVEILEPAVPLLLAAVGATALLSADAGPVAFALIGLVGALGVAGFLGWRGTTALTVRALLLTAVGFAMPLLEPQLLGQYLQWWYAVAAVYPLLLTRHGSALAVGLGASLMALYWVGDLQHFASVQGFALRCTLLTGIGLIVAHAGHAYRHAWDVALRRQEAAEHAERELHRASTHDDLTGLPNRASLDHFLDVALHQRAADRADDQPGDVALLLLDLDRFKNVNETLGHLAGDRLLREVGERLSGVIAAHHRIARLGGDEFAVVCYPATEAAAQRFADELVGRFDQPVEVGGAPYRIGLSVGVAVTGDGIEDRGDLLRCADAAMYAAKGAGRGRAVVYHRSMSDDVAANLAVEQRLRTAITDDGINAVFQPVVDLGTGRVVAAEALARWELDGTVVSPLRFVPLAEELGLGRDLAVVIGRQAVQALAGWHAAGLTDVASVAINISATDLLSPGLGEQLAALVRAAGLPPGSLTLEITERDVVLDVESTRRTLQQLRRHGITVAVDDFGTGFSSLAYLARLPLQVLKIDREFVANLGQDDTIARTVVQLAESFGMECIAEGIETPEQLAALARLGVHAGQGWHFGRPGDAREFVQRVRAQDSARA